VEKRRIKMETNCFNEDGDIVISGEAVAVAKADRF